MTVLRPTSVDGKIFLWKGNHGVAEISDFGPRFQFGRVYDDACDEGLTVVGKHGKEIVFAQDGYDTNSDDEIAGWRLVSVWPREAKDKFTLLVIND